jgi:hypothetical protein
VAQALHIESGAHEPQLWRYPFPLRQTCALSLDSQMAVACCLSVVRAPFPADSYSVCLASQKKLLKQLIILDKVITRYEGFSLQNNDCRAS